MRDSENVVTFKGDFRGQPIQDKTFLIARVLRTSPCQPFFVKIDINSQKFSSMRHVNAKFGFGIGVQLQANSHMTLPDTRGKARYHSNQCWD